MMVSIAQGTGEGDSEMPEYGTNVDRGQRPRISSASRHGPSLGGGPGAASLPTHSYNNKCKNQPQGVRRIMEEIQGGAQAA